MCIPVLIALGARVRSLFPVSPKFLFIYHHLNLQISKISNSNSLRECPSELKCIATGLGHDGLSLRVTLLLGFLLVFQMSEICSRVLIRILSLVVLALLFVILQMVRYSPGGSPPGVG